MHLLEEARHRRQQIRAHQLAVIDDGLHALGIPYRPSQVKQEIMPHHPLEGVGQGQEAQVAPHLGMIRDHLQHAGHGGEVILLGQHHPLGHPGGAAGVDDAEGVVRAVGAGNFIKAFLVFRGCFQQCLKPEHAGDILIHPPGKDEHIRQRGDHVPHRQQLFQLRFIFHEEHPRFQIVEDIGNLSGEALRINRRGDTPGQERADIGIGPFRAVLGKDHRPVAGLDAALQQPMRNRSADIAKRPVGLRPAGIGFQEQDRRLVAVTAKIFQKARLQRAEVNRIGIHAASFPGKDADAAAAADTTPSSLQFRDITQYQRPQQTVKGMFRFDCSFDESHIFPDWFHSFSCQLSVVSFWRVPARPSKAEKLNGTQIPQILQIFTDNTEFFWDKKIAGIRGA